MHSTIVRERLISVDCDGVRFKKILARSSISEVDTARSWEDIVDMIAASTAVKTRPAGSGWNMTWAMSRKMVSKFSWSVIL